MDIRGGNARCARKSFRQTEKLLHKKRSFSVCMPSTNRRLRNSRKRTERRRDISRSGSMNVRCRRSVMILVRSRLSSIRPSSEISASVFFEMQYGRRISSFVSWKKKLFQRTDRDVRLLSRSAMRSVRSQETDYPDFRPYLWVFRSNIVTSTPRRISRSI